MKPIGILEILNKYRMEHQNEGCMMLTDVALLKIIFEKEPDLLKGVPQSEIDNIMKGSVFGSVYNNVDNEFMGWQIEHTGKQEPKPGFVLNEDLSKPKYEIAQDCTFVDNRYAVKSNSLPTEGKIKKNNRNTAALNAIQKTSKNVYKPTFDALKVLGWAYDTKDGEKIIERLSLIPEDLYQEAELGPALIEMLVQYDLEPTFENVANVLELVGFSIRTDEEEAAVEEEMNKLYTRFMVQNILVYLNSSANKEYSDAYNNIQRSITKYVDFNYWCNNWNKLMTFVSGDNCDLESMRDYYSNWAKNYTDLNPFDEKDFKLKLKQYQGIDIDEKYQYILDNIEILQNPKDKRFNEVFENALGFNALKTANKNLSIQNFINGAGDALIMLMTLGLTAELNIVKCGKALAVGQSTAWSTKLAAKGIKRTTKFGRTTYKFASKAVKLSGPAIVGGVELGGFEFAKGTVGNLTTAKSVGEFIHNECTVLNHTESSFFIGFFGGIWGQTAVANIQKLVTRTSAKMTKALAQKMAEQGSIDLSEVVATYIEKVEPGVVAKFTGGLTEVVGFSLYDSALTIWHARDNWSEMSLEDLTNLLWEEFKGQGIGIGQIKILSLFLFAKGGRTAQKASIDYLSQTKEFEGVKVREVQENGKIRYVLESKYTSVECKSWDEVIICGLMLAREGRAFDEIVADAEQAQLEQTEVKQETESAKPEEPTVKPVNNEIKNTKPEQNVETDVKSNETKSNETTETTTNRSEQTSTSSEPKLATAFNGGNWENIFDLGNMQKTERKVNYKQGENTVTKVIKYSIPGETRPNMEVGLDKNGKLIFVIDYIYTNTGMHLGTVKFTPTVDGMVDVRYTPGGTNVVGTRTFENIILERINAYKQRIAGGTEIPTVHSKPVSALATIESTLIEMVNQANNMDLSYDSENNLKTAIFLNELEQPILKITFNPDGTVAHSRQYNYDHFGLIIDGKMKLESYVDVNYYSDSPSVQGIPATRQVFDAQGKKIGYEPIFVGTIKGKSINVEKLGLSNYWHHDMLKFEITSKYTDPLIQKAKNGNYEMTSEAYEDGSRKITCTNISTGKVEIEFFENPDKTVDVMEHFYDNDTETGSKTTYHDGETAELTWTTQGEGFVVYRDPSGNIKEPVKIETETEKVVGQTVNPEMQQNVLSELQKQALSAAVNNNDEVVEMYSKMILSDNPSPDVINQRINIVKEHYKNGYFKVIAAQIMLGASPKWFEHVDIAKELIFNLDRSPYALLGDHTTLFINIKEADMQKALDLSRKIKNGDINALKELGHLICKEEDYSVELGNETVELDTEVIISFLAVSDHRGVVDYDKAINELSTDTSNEYHYSSFVRGILYQYPELATISTRFHDDLKKVCVQLAKEGKNTKQDYTDATHKLLQQYIDNGILPSKIKFRKFMPMEDRHEGYYWDILEYAYKVEHDKSEATVMTARPEEPKSEANPAVNGKVKSQLVKLQTYNSVIRYLAANHVSYDYVEKDGKFIIRISDNTKVFLFDKHRFDYYVFENGKLIEKRLDCTKDEMGEQNWQHHRGRSKTINSGVNPANVTEGVEAHNAAQSLRDITQAEQKIYTKQELADMKGVTYQTIWKMVKDGVLVANEDGTIDLSKGDNQKHYDEYKPSNVGRRVSKERSGQYPKQPTEKQTPTGRTKGTGITEEPGKTSTQSTTGNQTPPNKELSIAEYAEMLGLSKNTVNLFIEKGNIIVNKDGKIDDNNPKNQEFTKFAISLVEKLSAPEVKAESNEGKNTALKTTTPKLVSVAEFANMIGIRAQNVYTLKGLIITSDPQTNHKMIDINVESNKEIIRKYHVKKYAEILGLSENTIELFIKKGNIVVNEDGTIDSKNPVNQEFTKYAIDLVGKMVNHTVSDSTKDSVVYERNWEGKSPQDKLLDLGFEDAEFIYECYPDKAEKFLRALEIMDLYIDKSKITKTTSSDIFDNNEINGILVNQKGNEFQIENLQQLFEKSKMINRLNEVKRQVDIFLGGKTSGLIDNKPYNEGTFICIDNDKVYTIFDITGKETITRRDLQVFSTCPVGMCKKLGISKIDTEEGLRIVMDQGKDMDIASILRIWDAIYGKNKLPVRIDDNNPKYPISEISFTSDGITIIMRDGNKMDMQTFKAIYEHCFGEKSVPSLNASSVVSNFKSEVIEAINNEFSRLYKSKTEQPANLWQELPKLRNLWTYKDNDKFRKDDLPKLLMDKMWDDTCFKTYRSRLRFLEKVILKDDLPWEGRRSKIWGYYQRKLTDYENIADKVKQFDCMVKEELSSGKIHVEKASDKGSIPCIKFRFNDKVYGIGIGECDSDEGYFIETIYNTKDFVF